MKKIITILILIFCLGCLAACAGEQDKGSQKNNQIETDAADTVEEKQSEVKYEYYSLDDGTLSIYSYESENPTTTIIIPAELDGMTVSKIEGPLFRDEENIRTVMLPETLTIIGEEAFYGAKSIEVVEINSAINCVEDHAFYQCRNLQRLDFSYGLKTIGYVGIADCEKLQEIRLSSEIMEIDRFSNFYDCAEDLVIYAPAGSIAETIAKDMGITFMTE